MWEFANVILSRPQYGKGPNYVQVLFLERLRKRIGMTFQIALSQAH